MKRLMRKTLFMVVICEMVFGVIVGSRELMAIDTNEGLNLSEIYIKAVNPGYTMDGKSNIGEMIEIAKRDSDAMIALAGVTVRYTNSSGNTAVLLEFPENSYLAGESILLRLASSEGSELAAMQYTKTLAMKAGLELWRGDEKIDEVCWSGKNDCYKEFVSTKPTTLVRSSETGAFEHWEQYEPNYDENAYKYTDDKKDEEEKVEKTSQCKKLIFSEILSYYETLQSEQFIELYNVGSEQILLDGCKIRYKNKTYALFGIVKPEEYFALFPNEFALTKNPASSNMLELVDTDDSVIDKLVYPNGQRKGTAYALIGFDDKGEEIWKTTYAPTPGMANNYQEYRTCEVGKVINEATGNCVKVTSVAEKVCGEGQYLNLLTGRCKIIETKEEKTCKEGYYLNPETGRCRKIVENNGADYSVVQEQFEESSSFVGLYAVIGALIVGVGVVIYEFRQQLMGVFRRMVRK